MNQVTDTDHFLTNTILGKVKKTVPPWGDYGGSLIYLILLNISYYISIILTMDIDTVETGLFKAYFGNLNGESGQKINIY